MNQKISVNAGTIAQANRLKKGVGQSKPIGFLKAA
jgi:hypothetical protein